MEKQRKTVMRAKKLKIKAEDLVKRYQDLLEIARWVSWCLNRDHLIKTCLVLYLTDNMGRMGVYKGTERFRAYP